MKQLPSYFILVLLTVMLLPSCQKEEQSIPDLSNTIFGDIPAALADSLQTIGPELQLIEIDPAQDNVIRGKGGTVLFISANSLVDGKGDPISGKALVELKEHQSLADYVSGNLQTMHKDEILQTQGMVFFSAKTGQGAPVRIDPDKPIRIEIPVEQKNEKAKIFLGKREPNGNMNWDQMAEPSKLLVPFPIRSIAPQAFGECPKDFGITDDPEIKASEYGESYWTFDDLSRFENTLLATREFSERFYQYCMPDLTQIYIDNLDKNMWEIDELVVQYFIQDSTERVDHYLNHRPPGPNGGKRTAAQEEAHQWLLQNAKESGHRMLEIYKRFAAQKLTKIDPSRLIPDSTLEDMNTAFVGYDALEFGWVNVDYFYSDPKAEKVKLIAEVNIPVAIINLIIPGKGVLMPGIPNGENSYAFTKREDLYSKLPKGEKAILLAIGLTDNQISFADREIIIGENETESLVLEATTGQALKTQLLEYGK